jgi:hypothetical protein
VSEHRAVQLAHFMRLYDAPGFGPDYVRHAVRTYLDQGGACRDIGHDIKQLIDQRSEENGSDAAKTAQRLPRPAR